MIHWESLVCTCHWLPTNHVIQVTQSVFSICLFKRKQLDWTEIWLWPFRLADKYVTQQKYHVNLTRGEVRGPLSFSSSVCLCGRPRLDRRRRSSINQSHIPLPPYCVNWHCDCSSYTRAAALRQGEGEGTRGRLLAPFLPSSPLLKNLMMGVSVQERLFRLLEGEPVFGSMCMYILYACHVCAGFLEGLCGS